MRLTALTLLAAASVASAARPIDAALSTSEGANAQRRIGDYGQQQFGDGEEVPELYPGENEDVGPQYLMVPKFRKTLFEAGVDVQYYYTSNALLSEKGNVDTGILLSTAFLGVAPTPMDLWGGKVAVRAGYRQQMYNYGLDKTGNQLNNLDFAVGTTYLGGRYTFGANWTLSLGVDYNRYLSAENGFTEFYTEVLPQWGVEKLFEVNERNFFTVGYFGGLHFTYTDPQPNSNANDRLDSIFLATWVHQFTDKLIVQPYYRFQQTHYWQNSDRNDAFNTFGVALAYLINDWSSVRVFSSYEVRDTNEPTIPDYHKFDTGGGVSVSVKF